MFACFSLGCNYLDVVSLQTNYLVHKMCFSRDHIRDFSDAAINERTNHSMECHGVDIEFLGVSWSLSVFQCLS